MDNRKLNKPMLLILFHGGKVFSFFCKNSLPTISRKIYISIFMADNNTTAEDDTSSSQLIQFALLLIVEIPAIPCRGVRRGGIGGINPPSND
jgi:hypothetical protein